jgi:type IV pilus assembly protein PilN
VTIKVNLLPREARAARARRAAAAPQITIGGGLVTQVLLGVLVLLGLVMGVLGYRAWAAKRDYQVQITRLKAQNDQLKVQLTELRQAEEAKREIQRRIEIIGKVAKSQGVPLATLNGVLKAVPQGIWLSSLEMKPRETKVRVEPRAAIAGSSDVLGRLESKRAEVEGAPPAGGPRPPATAAQAREVTQLTGYSLVIKGAAFTNFQIADFMDNLRKTGIFSDVDFVLTQAERVEQTRVMSFEVTAMVTL